MKNWFLIMVAVLMVIFSLPIYATEPGDVCPTGATTVTDPDGSFLCYTTDSNGGITFFYSQWYSNEHGWMWDRYENGQLDSNWVPWIPIPCAPIGGIGGCANTCMYKESCQSCVKDYGDEIYQDCVYHNGEDCFGNWMANRVQSWWTCRNLPSAPTQ